jgi:hypothetical protein
VIDRFASRGIFYFSGCVRCPLAGIGSRPENASNRLALDDDSTAVTIDHEAARITVENSRSYADKTVVCDLMFLAIGISAAGERKPFGIHLKILKEGRKFSVDLHRHLRSQVPSVRAEYEPYEVVVIDGETRRVMMDKAEADRLIKKPSFALRVVKSLMAMRDHLDGIKQDPKAPGYRVADLSVGFGALGLNYMIARAQLESRSADNARLIERGDVVEMLRDGAWELRLTAFSEKWLPEVVQRDMFLFGLDDVELLEPVKQHGLRKNQTLAFRFDKGQGEVLLDGKSEPFAGALDTARAYLEFHMLGGLLVENAEMRRDAKRP